MHKQSGFKHKNPKRKVEIIEISLDLDLEAEIKEATDNLQKLTPKIDKIVESAKLKSQPIVTKKQRDKIIWHERLEKMFEALKNMSSQEQPYRALNFVLEKAGVELTKSETIGVNTRLRNYLKKEKNNRWALLTRRSKGRTLYALAKFGD